MNKDEIAGLIAEFREHADYEHEASYGNIFERAADALTTLSARVETLEAALEWYADQMCEGWCDKDPKACAAIGGENCAGCHARKELGGGNG